MMGMWPMKYWINNLVLLNSLWILKVIYLIPLWHYKLILLNHFHGRKKQISISTWFSMISKLILIHFNKYHFRISIVCKQFWCNVKFLFPFIGHCCGFVTFNFKYNHNKHVSETKLLEREREREGKGGVCIWIWVYTLIWLMGKN